MAVVQFPNEIIRRFLTRLDAARRFSDYLGALAYCARKELDPSPLHSWWRIHSSETLSDNFELDFIDFLNGIITSPKTWDTARAERLEEIEAANKSMLERENTESRTGFERTLDEYLRSVNEQRSTRERFMDDHPEYRCVYSAADYHEIFSTFFDERDHPLKVIARWASALLPCGLPVTERLDDYEPGFSPRGGFGLEDERPAAFLIGSDPHGHLLELADWVTEQAHNEQLGVVLRWSLNNECFGLAPSGVMQAACSCSQKTFVHLIAHQEVEPEDVDGLIALLSVPLALSASVSGPPHLLPEFSFLGAASYFDTSIRGMNGTTGRKDLVAAWRQFFQRYRRLRLTKNGSRGFAGGGELFRTALANFAGDESCYTDSGSTCVEDCIRNVHPDESCLLAYFLFLFAECDEIVQSDAQSDSQRVPEFSLKKTLLPTLSILRANSMHELASAMLAYYLVLSSVAANGNLDALEGLDEALLQSRRLPGAACVERALEFICELAKARGHRITEMKFEQFLVSDDRKVLELIAGGEGETIEFKSTLRMNLHTGQPDRKIEYAVLKTIGAFLNKRGGVLLVGVDDEKNVLGIESDRFANADKLMLHFKNLVSATAPKALDQIVYKVVTLERKEILYVECTRGDQPIYMRNRETKQHEFYVRRGPATDQLDLPDAIAYIQKEFPESRLGTGEY